MEVGYLEYSEASAFGGQVLDEKLKTSLTAGQSTVSYAQRMLNASVRLTHARLMPHNDPGARAIKHEAAHRSSIKLLVFT